MFNVQTSHWLLNYNIHILLKFLVFNASSVTKTVLVLLSTFSNANFLRKALNFDKVQNTWPPYLISKMVLRNTYDVTCHV